MNIVDDAWATFRLTPHPQEITLTFSYVHDDSLVLNESCPRKQPGLFYHHPGISFPGGSKSPYSSPRSHFLANTACLLWHNPFCIP